jgi:helicase
MNLDDVRKSLPYEVSESLESRGIREFTPPQEMALRGGLLSGANMLISSPTASGKTLVAELACIRSIILEGKKAVYIAPMKALVGEKYREFSEAYPFVKCSMSTGDLDSTDQRLADSQMIFVSTEKFDSLMRHGIGWLGSIGCIVFDEVHMIGEGQRGPTLEMLMTKLFGQTKAQMIALSATVGNAGEIAEWMGAELVQSDFRPVKLFKGVVYGSSVCYKDEGSRAYKSIELEGKSAVSEARVVEDTLSMGKQAIIFYASKRNAEAGAARLALAVGKQMQNKDELEGLASKVLNVLERPTEQCIKLSGLVSKGVAFHHAGLLSEQKSLVENAFAKGLIKVICSTTTLGLGVNLPAHTVLIKDVHRYNGFGSDRIGINEVTQLLGRAGRPRYDTTGRGLITAPGEEQAKRLYRDYFESELDPVYSGIGVVPVLRTHILALISEEYCNNMRELSDFIGRTFYGKQYSDRYRIEELLEEVVSELVRWDFVEEINGGIKATRLGRRVSELYIDPLSARWILDSIGRERDTLGSLFMLCNTLEMRPHVKATEEAMAMFSAYAHTAKGRFVLSSGDDVDDPVRAFSTALMLNDWIEEKREPEIMKKYGTTPGALFNKLSNAYWLIYSAIELARMQKARAHDLVELNVRLRYGIKAELLDLVRLEQVGRVRARMLYNNGIRSVEEARAHKDRLSTILGKEVGERIAKQL